VNEVQQFVIVTARDDGSQAAKNLVVEHKGGMRWWAFLVVSYRSSCDSVGMCFEGPASRSGCAFGLSIACVPDQLRHRLPQREGSAVGIVRSRGPPPRPRCGDSPSRTGRQARIPGYERAARSSGFRVLAHCASRSRKPGNRSQGEKGKHARSDHRRCARLCRESGISVQAAPCSPSGDMPAERIPNKRRIIPDN